LKNETQHNRSKIVGFRTSTRPPNCIYFFVIVLSRNRPQDERNPLGVAVPQGYAVISKSSKHDHNTLGCGGHIRCPKYSLLNTFLEQIGNHFPNAVLYQVYLVIQKRGKKTGIVGQHPAQKRVFVKIVAQTGEIKFQISQPDH